MPSAHQDDGTGYVQALAINPAMNNDRVASVSPIYGSLDALSGADIDCCRLDNCSQKDDSDCQHG